MFGFSRVNNYFDKHIKKCIKYGMSSSLLYDTRFSYAKKYAINNGVSTKDYWGNYQEPSDYYLSFDKEIDGEIYNITFKFLDNGGTHLIVQTKKHSLENNPIIKEVKARKAELSKKRQDLEADEMEIYSSNRSVELDKEESSIEEEEKLYKEFLSLVQENEYFETYEDAIVKAKINPRKLVRRSSDGRGFILADIEQELDSSRPDNEKPPDFDFYDDDMIDYGGREIPFPDDAEIPFADGDEKKKAQAKYLKRRVGHLKKEGFKSNSLIEPYNMDKEDIYKKLRMEGIKINGKIFYSVEDANAEIKSFEKIINSIEKESKTYGTSDQEINNIINFSKNCKSKIENIKIAFYPIELD